MQFSIEMQPLARREEEGSFLPGRSGKEIVRVPEIGSSADKRDARSRARTIPRIRRGQSRHCWKIIHDYIRRIIKRNFKLDIFASYICVKYKAGELK